VGKASGELERRKNGGEERGMLSAERERGRGLEIFKKKCNKTSVLYPLPLTITPLNFLMCFKHTQVHLNAL
jgi:hypothetical protein